MMPRLDPLFFAFLTSAALIIITPGAATAVVIRNAVAGGRFAALATAGGIAVGSASWAILCCAGLSLVVSRLPSALQVLKWVGGGYLAFLGLQSLREAAAPGTGDPDAPAPSPGAGIRLARADWSAYATQGVITNLLNPALVIFYVSYVPQFIRSNQPFVARYLLLAGIHITMAFACHNVYGFTIGGFATAMSRPRVRRALQIVTGAALLGLGVNLAIRS